MVACWKQFQNIWKFRSGLEASAPAAAPEPTSRKRPAAAPGTKAGKVRGLVATSQKRSSVRAMAPLSRTNGFETAKR